MCIHFGRPEPINTLADAILRYGDREFESVTRSTIPMLSLLNHHHDPVTFRTIAESLDVPDPSELYLEYTVSPPQGKGKASHTDVMIKSGQCSWAIEAKWTEPMYDTVTKWLEKVSQPNGTIVLKGWLEIIGQRLNQAFDYQDFGDVIYQMIHRTASAIEAGASSRVVYLLFKMPGLNAGATMEQITERLETLWRLLGCPENLPFSVVEISIEPTELYLHLQAVSQANQNNRHVISQEVIAALGGRKPLFVFTANEPVIVGGA